MQISSEILRKYNATKSSTIYFYLELYAVDQELLKKTQNITV